MKKHLRLLVSIAFLVFSSLIIGYFPRFHIFLPSQHVELSHGVQYGAVLKDFLFVQEIKLQKRYLSGIDVYMAKLPGPVINSNVFLLIDDHQRILYTQKFKSGDFGEALHFPFHFDQVLDIGRGKTVYACIYSIDGDPQSYIGLARKDGSNFGKLYVMPILQNDVLQSFAGRQSVVEFPGSLGIRTFESNSRLFSLFQCLLYLMVLFISLLIFFQNSIRKQILNWNIRPELVFPVTGVIFGMVMLVITPPFQVPDEPVHFFRSWQITELNFFKAKDEVPKALKIFEDTCKRMNFSTHEKTKFAETASYSRITVDLKDKVDCNTPDYLIPYFPQAFGIFLGKLTGLNLLWTFYLGRFFNLIFTLILIYFAIRITPIYKWVFAIIGLLPMALYQFASYSYDAGTIGLSFLLLSLVLRATFRKDHEQFRKDFIRIVLIAILLATSKPPYFLMIMVFLIIPVSRAGNLKKYLVFFAILVFSVAIVSQMQGFSKKLAQKQAISIPGKKLITASIFHERIRIERLFSLNCLNLGFLNVTSDVSGDLETGTISNDQDNNQDSEANTSTQVVEPAPANNNINPSEQIHFILSHPVEYSGILINTLKKSGNLYAVSLIGLFGWIDTQVPDLLAYINILMLVILAFFSPEQGFVLTARQKMILFITFVLCFLLIETALYLYCNPVGSKNIIAIQGRYFIAIFPLLLFLFYRNSPGNDLLGFHKRKNKTGVSKKAGKKTWIIESSTTNVSRIKEIPILTFAINLITLLWSVYLILDRFYILSF